jgi:hypothetical protein
VSGCGPRPDQAGFPRSVITPGMTPVLAETNRFLPSEAAPGASENRVALSGPML